MGPQSGSESSHRRRWHGTGEPVAPIETAGVAGCECESTDAGHRGGPARRSPAERTGQFTVGGGQPFATHGRTVGYDGRLSRTVLREREGEVPSRHSPAWSARTTISWAPTRPAVSGLEVRDRRANHPARACCGDDAVHAGAQARLIVLSSPGACQLRVTDPSRLTLAVRTVGRWRRRCGFRRLWPHDATTRQQFVD